MSTTKIEIPPELLQPFFIADSVMLDFTVYTLAIENKDVTKTNGFIMRYEGIRIAKQHLHDSIYN